MISKSQKVLILWDGGIIINSIKSKIDNGISFKAQEVSDLLKNYYNYFEDWYRDMTSANDFSEIWDNVKEDKRWGDNGDVEWLNGKKHHYQQKHILKLVGK